jgi:hypothetical protein
VIDDVAVTDERRRRIGQNEALYRQVNERIEDMNEAFSTITENFSIVCECADLDCTEQITLSRERYEQTRRDPTHFFLKPGHEAMDTERVLDRAEDESYVIVEKASPEARRRAEETDPRS